MTDELKALRAADAETNTEPTTEQKRSGIYKKGRLHLHGLEIRIENPKGSTRSGVSASGKEWSTKMLDSYGYIIRISQAGEKFTQRSEADEDHMDCFVGDHPESQLAYVIDQVDPKTKEFDEAKIMLGFFNEKSAKEAYFRNYQANWKGFSAIHPVTIDDLKSWIGDGDTSKPYKAPETRKSGATGVSGMAADEGALPQSEKPGIQMVRGTWDSSMPGLVSQFSAIFSGHVPTPSWLDVGSDKCGSGVLQRELPVGNASISVAESPEQSVVRVSGEKAASGGLGSGNEDAQPNALPPRESDAVGLCESDYNAGRGAAQNLPLPDASRGDVADGGYGAPPRHTGAGIQSSDSERTHDSADSGSSFEEFHKSAKMKCPACGCAKNFKKLGDGIKCSECEKTSDIEDWFTKSASGWRTMDGTPLTIQEAASMPRSEVCFTEVVKSADYEEEYTDEEEEKSTTARCACGADVDLVNLPESAMGAVKCPQCDATHLTGYDKDASILQELRIAKEHSDIGDYPTKAGVFCYREGRALTLSEAAEIVRAEFGGTKSSSVSSFMEFMRTVYTEQDSHVA